MFQDIVSTLAKLAAELEPGCEGWRAVNELQRGAIELLSDRPVDADSLAFTLERAARRGLRKEARRRPGHRQLQPGRAFALELLRLLEPAELGTLVSRTGPDSRGSAPPRAAPEAARSPMPVASFGGAAMKQEPYSCQKCLHALIPDQPCVDIMFGERVTTMCGRCVSQFASADSALMALLAITPVSDDGES